MNRWPDQIKGKARALRKEGLSYGELTKKLGVSKSTLHSWIYDLRRPKYITDELRRRHLEEIRPLANAAVKRKREREIEIIIQKAKKEVQSWNFLNSIQVQKAFLSLLYWAEGQKLPERGAPLKFANTDPRLVLLYLTLLRNCYKIDVGRIKVKLYIHWYHKSREVKEFWKRLLDVKDEQFSKIYRKKRSKTKRFRKNYMGICFVLYQSVDLRQEIVHTAIALQERITKRIV